MLGKSIGHLAHLFIHLAILIPAFASAQSEVTTDYCQSSVFIGIQIKNTPNNQKITCADVQKRFEQALEAVEKISPVDLSDTLLVIANWELPRGSRYSWVSSTMFVDLPHLDLIENRAMVFYHELGHKIYFKYMAEAVQEVKDRLPALQNYVQFLKDCETTAKPELPVCQTKEPYVDMLAANDSFSKDFDTFIYINSPYNELFADVVASLAADDKDAIAKVMDACTYSDYACEYRAFSKNTIDKFAGENFYSKFSSIRRDLWDGWIAPRLTDKPELLNELGRLLIDESITYYIEDFKLIEGMQALVELKRLKEKFELKQTELPTLKYEL